MIRLLAKWFIRGKNAESPERVRSAYGVLSGCFGIFLNLVLFTVKLVFGLFAHAVSLQADAFNNLGDAGSSVISLFGFRLASKKPDRDHPYGHGRFEYISGMFVSIAIILMGWSLFRNALGIVLHGGEPAYASHFIPSVCVMAAAIAVKLYMFLYNRALAKRFDSPALRAVAFDSLSDTVATGAVLVSALITHYVKMPEWVRPDAWSGLLVSLFILYTGLKSVKETTAPLLGKRPDPEFVSAIEEATLSFEGIGGVHDVIVHDYGPGRVFVSLHAEVPADADVRDIHEVIDNAEKYLSDRFRCVATIHMDPIITDDPETARLRTLAVDALRTVGPELSIHDFRAVQGPQNKTLLFDVSVPYTYTESDAALRERIENAVAERIPGCLADVTIDRADS
ncbi:MAG: cation diffusion facilitator family transporter [Clostridia bacterium]|nr:cation diffusion facilitator family transporter [Clostridia bacterium]